jgi:hypothetical protein
MYDPKLSTIEDDHYVYDKQKYYLFFPYDWVQNMFPGTGPNMCEKCVLHGSKKGVFIGYCYDCANYVYDCKRGHGFENGQEDVDMVNKETSANFTYLKYTKHMNIAYEPTANIGIQRSNSFSLKTISKESDEMIEAVRRSNSLTSTNSELSFLSRGNSVDYE